MAQYLFCIDIPGHGPEAFHSGDYSDDEAQWLLDAVQVKYEQPDPSAINLAESGHPQVDVVGALAEWAITERRLNHLEANQKQLVEALGADPHNPIAMSLTDNAYWLYPRWYWAREVAKQIVAARMKMPPAAQKAQCEGNGEAGSTPKKARSTKTPTIPKLSERQYNILQAMLELGAMAVQDRTTTEKIALKAEGSGTSPEQFKRPMSNLKKRKLVDSQDGRDGGSWLTDKGRTVAELLRNKGDTKQ